MIYIYIYISNVSRTLDNVKYTRVSLAAFDRQCALTDSREAHLERQQLRDTIMPTEAFDASSCEDQRIIVGTIVEL